MTQITKNTYDLEERTQRFGERIIDFCRSLPVTPVTRRIIDQLTGSGTSIGANYMEANGASSKRDFRNKIHITRKEAQETKHWLRMVATAIPERKEEARELWQEAHELTLIFQAISVKVRTKA